MKILKIYVKPYKDEKCLKESFDSAFRKVSLQHKLKPNEF